MAPDRRWAVLALAVLLAACGGSKKEAELEAAENAKLAALRARTDSIRKAKAAADSLAQVAYTACSDSVTAALQKTAAGRRSLKKAAGAVAPEVTTACGEPRFTAGTLAAKGDSAAASAQNAPGEATPAQQLARADSARRAQLDRSRPRAGRRQDRAQRRAPARWGLPGRGASARGCSRQLDRVHGRGEAAHSMERPRPPGDRQAGRSAHARRREPRERGALAARAIPGGCSVGSEHA